MNDTPSNRSALVLQRLFHLLWRPLLILTALGLLVMVIYLNKSNTPETQSQPAIPSVGQLTMEDAPGPGEPIIIQRLWEILYSGDQLLLINHDVSGALRQLQLANNLLGNTKTGWLLPLKLTIEKDMAQLRSYQQLNISGVIVQLQWIEQSVGDLPILTERPSGKVSPTKPVPWPNFRTDPKEWFQRLGQDLWQPFAGLMSITRLKDADNSFTVPSQIPYAREQLKLHLLNARLALLSQQPAMAAQEVHQALRLLDRAFNGRNASVRQAVGVLGAIKGLENVPTAPTLTSLMTLNGILQNSQLAPPSAANK